MLGSTITPNRFDEASGEEIYGNGNASIQFDIALLAAAHEG